MTGARRLRAFVPAGRNKARRMPETHNRRCKCGAVYSRFESIAPSRQISSFECLVCGATIESWNTAWVPTYRLIAGPVKLPEQ